jgi:hypothetical protein
MGTIASALAWQTLPIMADPCGLMMWIL